MILHMEILKIYLEEQLLIKYYMIKHLLLLKIQIMMDINVDFASMVYKFLDRITSGGVVKSEIIAEPALFRLSCPRSS